MPVEALILLAAVWWTWAITTLVTDMYDPERTEIKLLITAVMFGALLMTTAIPEAFGARSWSSLSPTWRSTSVAGCS